MSLHLQTIVEDKAQCTSATLPRIKIKPSRFINMNDEHSVLAKLLEADFYKKQRNGQVDSITLILNPLLKSAFEETKEEFKRRQIPHQSVFAYHGTDPSNLDSIFAINFDVNRSRRQAHGCGMYFSEHPQGSFQ